MKVFSQWTSIPRPNGNGTKGTLATRWYAPLNRLWVMCGRDDTRSAQLIKDSIDLMREKKLNISAPQSIEKVSASIYGASQYKSINNRTGIARDIESYEDQINTPGTAAYRLAHRGEGQQVERKE